MTEPNEKLGTLKRALEEVATAGEAARVQLHLLSMEARDRTSELGASIEGLEHKLDRGIEHAMATAASKTRQLTHAVQEFLGRQPSRDSSRPNSVRSVMTAGVRTCREDDALNLAAQIMWDNDCGATPVVDREGRLRGIITDRDICMAAYTGGAPLWALRVHDCMSLPVHTCSPEDSLERAVAIMAGAQVRRLPVVDAEGRPLGIVSLADIANNVAVIGEQNAQALVLELLRAISKQRRADSSNSAQAAAG
jgi:CBS domain-containing protein